MVHSHHAHFIRNLVIVIVILAFIALVMNFYNPHIPEHSYTELPPIEEKVETPVKHKLAPVSLSATELVLLQGESRDIVLTIGNNYETAKDFEIIIDCVDYQGTGCAKMDIKSQIKFTVPPKSIEKTPISINTLSDIEKGNYELFFYVRQNSKTYGKEQLFVQIK